MVTVSYPGSKTAAVHTAVTEVILPVARGAVACTDVDPSSQAILLHAPNDEYPVCFPVCVKIQKALPVAIQWPVVRISTVSDSDTEMPYNWTPIPISHIIGPRRCVEAKGNVIPLPWAW